MVARWLEPKLLKMRKDRHKYRTFKSQGVSQTKIAAYEIYQNRRRVQSTKSGKDEDGAFTAEVEPILNNTFTKNIPDTFSNFTNNPEASVYPPDQSDHKKVRITELKAWDPEVQGDGVYTVPKGWNPTPRAEAVHLAKIERMGLEDKLVVVLQTPRFQKVVEFNRRVLKQNNDYSLTLYFQGQELIFIQKDSEDVFISITYKSWPAAKAAHANNKIVWKIHRKVRQP